MQLLLLHLRSNLLLLFVWLLLTLFLTGNLGESYGLQLLFVAPEYLGNVGFWSFFILGLAYGGLYISWNVTCYLLNAHHFPFLASLEKPFTKFCLNNSLLPLAFALLLMLLHVRFENHFMYSTFGNVLVNCAGFLVGSVVLLLITSVYFQFLNKDIQNYPKRRSSLPPNLARELNPGNRKVSIEDIKSEKTKWRVDTYLSLTLRPRLVRSVAHYDIRLLLGVFKQNHINALVMQLLSFFLLILLGMLVEYPAFRIPAAASIFLICSLLCAFVGAVSYWFSRWRLTVLLLFAIAVNFITSKEYFNHKNKAYGLDYEIEKAEYSHARLKEICSLANITEDYKNTEAILNNWKKRVAKPGKKPKMVVYCVTGGGLKAAVWAVQVLQHTDKFTDGAFTRHTTLMAGASGGMIGTAYYRELLLRKKQGLQPDIYAGQHIDNISKDLLNSVAVSIAGNDLFMPFLTFETNGHSYVKDRGYIFEKQLNENTENVFGKNLCDYGTPEQNAEIPMMYFTPSVVNDGRRMVISPQGVSFMMAPPAALKNPDAIDIDAVDFGRLFAEQDSKNLRFTTALRANATFPYILPNVFLPTDPQIEMVDAGFRDNFGLKSAVRFLHVYKDWIRENTDGIVLVQVNGNDRDTDITPSNNTGVFGSLLSPLGIAGQVINLQSYENDNNFGLLYDVLGEENIDIVQLTYRPGSDNFEAPISFHLTERGRNDILDAIYQEKNQAAMRRIKELLE